MLTLSSQYALRAMIYMAQHVDQWPIPGRIIAKEAQIPPKYLSKILGDLVRAGVLNSNRGKSGGFSMRKQPDKTTLMSVLTPFEQFQQRNCPFGNKRCGDANPCLAHDQWKQVVEAEKAFFTNTTVHDVSVEVT